MLENFPKPSFPVKINKLNVEKPTNRDPHGASRAKFWKKGNIEIKLEIRMRQAHWKKKKKKWCHCRYILEMPSRSCWNRSNASTVFPITLRHAFYWKVNKRFIASLCRLTKRENMRVRHTYVHYTRQHDLRAARIASRFWKIASSTPICFMCNSGIFFF